jgi:hypothetical protein
VRRRSKRGNRAKKPSKKQAERLAYAHAAREMELALIRERLARRPEDRMDFLRVRLPGGGSTL